MKHCHQIRVFHGHGNHLCQLDVAAPWETTTSTKVKQLQTLFEAREGGEDDGLKLRERLEMVLTAQINRRAGRKWRWRLGFAGERDLEWRRKA